jgi:hypothetical protein
MGGDVTRDPLDILPGMIYEDCAFHPVICTHVHDDDSVSGISLIDGSSPRTCSIHDCGIVLLSITDVIEIRKDFAGYVARRRAGPSG